MAIAMADKHWKVKIFEAHSRAEEARVGKPATHVDNAGVTAENHDAAKAAAREFLTKRGFVIRSINHSATEPATLVAYVMKKEKAAR